MAIGRMSVFCNAQVSFGVEFGGARRAASHSLLSDFDGIHIGRFCLHERLERVG